jgi:hypothetical protein
MLDNQVRFWYYVDSEGSQKVSKIVEGQFFCRYSSCITVTGRKNGQLGEEANGE